MGRRLKLAKQPRIVLIQGSPRAEDNCPQERSKQSMLIEEIQNHPDFRHVIFDVIDLAVREKSIQPCKGCVSMYMLRAKQRKISGSNA